MNIISKLKQYTVNPLYNEFGIRVDQAFIIKKFVNAITNYSLYISNNLL